MASGFEITKQRHALRALTPNSGFSVRQSEETIKTLRKENFNLKLKIFMLESKKGGAALMPDSNDLNDKEYFDLFVENESMRNELEEKQTLLKSALDVIQNLEDQKLNFEQKCQDMMVEQQIQTFQLLKVNTKTRKIIQIRLNFCYFTGQTETPSSPKVANEILAGEEYRM
jgi:Centrosomin N-terminal motif 1